MRDKENIARITSPLRRLFSFDKRVIIMLNPVSNLTEDRHYKWSKSDDLSKHVIIVHVMKSNFLF